MTNPKYTLSTKKILITSILFILIPILSFVLNLFIQHEDMALMISCNLIGAIIIIYQWPLLELHHQRLKDKPGWSFYFVLAIIFISILVFLTYRYLQAPMVLPTADTLKRFGYARLGMLFAFSIIEACLFNISFKCLTDHMDIKQKEMQVILTSSIFFGLIITILFAPWTIFKKLISYIYHLFLIACLSYCYNQTTSILPGTLAMSIVYFITMLILYLA